MTPEQEALGRRAVAAVGDNWRAGMRVHVRGEWMRLVSTDDGIVHVSEVDGSVSEFPPTWVDEEPVLDVEDHATLGCVAALAREALGEPKANACTLVDGEWAIARRRAAVWVEALSMLGSWGTLGVIPDVIREPSEPAVWVAALEAAGRKQHEPDAPVPGGRSGASRAV